MTGAAQLRSRILDLVAEYCSEAFPEVPFTPGVTPVPVSGKVFDANEVGALVDSALDFWLTGGRFTEQFERGLARFMQIDRAVFVNSGSSANLLAVSALIAAELKDRRLRTGDEVITVAAGFPTTVNPIVQNGLVPVFVDVGIPDYNVDVTRLDAALSPRTRAIVLAHTLGNPFDLNAVTAFARHHGLWLIEDCCDALGSTYRGRSVGTSGDLATASFYPAHQITTGEGGAVLTGNAELFRVVESLRDWGRDCWCATGHDDTCRRRFDWKFGELPDGYDHKYIYSRLGYNLKATDMQAAVGLAQLQKLPGFIEARRRNFNMLYAGLRDLQEYLMLPEATAGAEPSWFGFPIAIGPAAPFTRRELIAHLERNRVATRLLFGGNLTRQPAYGDVRYRVAGDLGNTDFVMDRVFWIGIFPGITPRMVEYVVDIMHEFEGFGRAPAKAAASAGRT